MILPNMWMLICCTLNKETNMIKLLRLSVKLRLNGRMKEDLTYFFCMEKHHAAPPT